MNFLAHIYFSGDNDYVKIGNFIADAIKGKKYMEYSKEVQVGILLHRNIDSFTDKHPTVRISKDRLHSRYRHYDGVIIDILYDYFLAKNWSTYSSIPLNDYAQTFYAILNSNYSILPDKVKHLMPYMIKDNWLYSYRTIEGIEKVLQGMNRRTNNKSQMDMAVEDLKIHHSEFENDFKIFFEDLRIFCQEKLILLSS